VEAAERIEIVEELCSFEGRRAGTDAERRAANRLAERLREQGRRAEVEPTYVHPQWGLVHAAHCALAFGGSLLAVEVRVAGFALVLFAAVSTYLDLTYRVYLVRSLFFRRASQNVVSPGARPDAPLRLVLCAHYDAARTGWIYAPQRARRVARWAQGRPPIGPFRVIFWSMAALLPLLGARMAGAESDAIALAQLPFTLALLVSIFLLVDIELSDVVPGANANASGVATALSLASELDAEAPEHLDIWVLLTGAEEGQQEGMRAYLRAHRRELDPERTLFLNLTSLGHGAVRYEAAAGWVAGYGLDPRAIELCAAIAEADRDDRDRDTSAPSAVAHAFATDALPPRVGRFRSIGITCLDEDGYPPHYRLPSDTPETLDPAALDRAHSFALELIRALDRDTARTAAVAAAR
jgi:Peptidase family M28